MVLEVCDVCSECRTMHTFHQGLLGIRRIGGGPTSTEYPSAQIQVYTPNTVHVF